MVVSYASHLSTHGGWLPARHPAPPFTLVDPPRLDYLRRYHVPAHAAAVALFHRRRRRVQVTPFPRNNTRASAPRQTPLRADGRGQLHRRRAIRNPMAQPPRAATRNLSIFYQVDVQRK